VALRADDVDLGRDRALVEQYQEGDLAAFEDLYRRYYGRLFRFCLRRTGNPHEAEELTQEAFARAYRAMPMLRGERRFYPWLSVIASRLCIDSHRRLGRTEPTAEIDLGAVEFGDHGLEAAVDHDLLREAMARLNDRHREVLHLREREGWSYQHIADHFDISLSAVEGLLFRARQALRREFLAVAGPEAGMAAALPLGLGAGLAARLGRRLAGLKLRVSEYAASWVNMPALAANGVGLAMVVTTAGGIATAVVDGITHQPRQVSVTVAASPISAVQDVPDPAPAVPAAAPAPARVDKPAAPAPTGNGRSGGEVPHTGAYVWHRNPEGRARTEDQPVEIDGGDTIAGVDPDEVGADLRDHANAYIEEIKGDLP
jgi:RNA polymerase sigma-70 factor, ECF subfamily